MHTWLFYIKYYLLKTRYYTMISSFYHHYQLGAALVVVAAGERLRGVMVCLVECCWLCFLLHLLWVLVEPFSD